MNPSIPDSLSSQMFEYRAQLQRRARNLCSCSAEADDLVQETFIRAISHQGQFEAGTNLRAWLMRILYHAFVSRHRQHKRERAALERYAFEQARIEPASSVECTNALPEHLKRALGVLPDCMAEVVRLVDLDEFSYREAAESLKVPVGTVMSRLFRGRQRLATSLGQPVTPAASCAA